MDGPSIQSHGYTLPSVPPTDVRTPAPRSDATAVTDAAASPSTAPNPTLGATPPVGMGAPGFAIAFPQGMAGQYVLDCRDPKTNAVLVQVPMCSAFTQIEGAATPEHVGKNVDTLA
jgi:hypothetical protein